MARESRAQFSTPRCGYCTSLTRPMFAPGRGKGKNPRTQHSRWRVCQDGHKLYTKKRKTSAL